MPKKRDKNSDEFYRGRIRELEKENRQLLKRVRQLEKTEHMFEEALLSDEEIVIEEVPKKRMCKHCYKGTLKEYTVLDRVFEECDLCEYRKKISG
jgi:cytochrome c-type biogenesis protein CcmH/NrfG